MLHASMKQRKPFLPTAWVCGALASSDLSRRVRVSGTGDQGCVESALGHAISFACVLGAWRLCATHGTQSKGESLQAAHNHDVAGELELERRHEGSGN